MPVEASITRTCSTPRPARLPAMYPAIASTVDWARGEPSRVVTVAEAVGLRTARPIPVASGMSRITVAERTPLNLAMSEASWFCSATMKICAFCWFESIQLCFSSRLSNIVALSPESCPFSASSARACPSRSDGTNSFPSVPTWLGTLAAVRNVAARRWSAAAIPGSSSTIRRFAENIATSTSAIVMITIRLPMSSLSVGRSCPRCFLMVASAWRNSSMQGASVPPTTRTPCASAQRQAAHPYAPPPSSAGASRTLES